jgi:hypothetical protein
VRECFVRTCEPSVPGFAMSALPVSLPDPPVPGSTVWRGWFTKTGSFIPSLKRRFATLQIGPDYLVTLDYREEPTSSVAKGFYTFSSATKCLQSSSIGSIPPQQCLIVEINNSTRVPCYFDSAADRQSFQAAVEWAVNARYHVAAFHTRQDKAKLAVKEAEMPRAEVKRGVAHDLGQTMLEGEHQDAAAKQRAAAPSRPQQAPAAANQEFISRLAREFEEYQTQLQRGAGRPQVRNVAAHGWYAGIQASEEVNARRAGDDAALPPLTTGKHWKDFTQRICQEQGGHAEQLAAAANLERSRSRSHARSVCAIANK